MLPVTSFLGIGSNLGDRVLNIKKALDYLRNTKGIYIFSQSNFYETLPEGGPKNQPRFLNAVIKIRTILNPFQLLERLKNIEASLKREKALKWRPRTIDLDILFYDDLVFASKELTIPHHLLHKRYFVLKPLSEIAPEFIHPFLSKSIRELFKELN